MSNLIFCLVITDIKPPAGPFIQLDHSPASIVGGPPLHFPEDLYNDVTLVAFGFCLFIGINVSLN